MPKKLEAYRKKRSPKKTPEPFTSKPTKEGKLVFVIQKHKATALHYDLRLESEGTMPSWAIPKGPSLDPTKKRLAMMTEDHPLDYRHFEGVIPQGEYGAGPVIIWDEGSYYPEVLINNEKKIVTSKRDGSRIIRQGIKKGKLDFFLMGKKIKGSFTLVKIKSGTYSTRGNAWLLIKHHDKYCKPGYEAGDYERSAVSRRTIASLLKLDNKRLNSDNE